MTDEGTKTPGGSPFWGRYRQVIETWVVFAISAGVMIQALIWSRPFTDEYVPRWVAWYTAFALDLLGAEGKVDGTLVHSSLRSVQIIRECTAVYPTALYLAAVLAYRCSWPRKLIGALGGILAIQMINLVRLVSLVYILEYYPESFEFAHLVVWQSLVVFLTLVVWLLWASTFASPPEPDAA